VARVKDPIEEKQIAIYVGDMRDLRHLCGHSQRTCAIYVPNRQLDVAGKKWVQTSAQKKEKNVIFRDIHGATDLF